MNETSQSQLWELIESLHPVSLRLDWLTAAFLLRHVAPITSHASTSNDDTHLGLVARESGKGFRISPDLTQRSPLTFSILRVLPSLLAFFSIVKFHLECRLCRHQFATESVLTYFHKQSQMLIEERQENVDKLLCFFKFSLVELIWKLYKPPD